MQVQISGRQTYFRGSPTLLVPVIVEIDDDDDSHKKTFHMGSLNSRLVVQIPHHTNIWEALRIDLNVAAEKYLCPSCIACSLVSRLTELIRLNKGFNSVDFKTLTPFILRKLHFNYTETA